MLYHVRQITYDLSLRKAEAASEAWREAKQSPSLCDCFGLASYLRLLRTANNCASLDALRLARNDKYLVRESMVGCPLPSLLQNRACDFHRTRLLSNVILVIDTILWSDNSL